MRAAAIRTGAAAIRAGAAAISTGAAAIRAGAAAIRAARRDPSRRRGSGGQASVLLVGGLLGVVLAAGVLGAVARGVGVRGEMQSAADLGALAGARVMRDAYARLFEPPAFGPVPNPRHLEKAEFLALGREMAERVARRNGGEEVRVGFPDEATLAPVRIAVRAARVVRGVEVAAESEAELAPPTADGLPAFAGGGGYDGPLAHRQGRPMRPDVAMAFDRMERAGRADGVQISIVSAFRSDAEQAVLFARHPDPRWVAPPGQSLHRLGTELDLGPEAAYGWLAANAPRFGFVQRYDQAYRAVSEALRSVPPLVIPPPAPRAREPYAERKRTVRSEALRDLPSQR